MVSLFVLKLLKEKLKLLLEMPASTLRNMLKNQGMLRFKYSAISTARCFISGSVIAQHNAVTKNLLKKVPPLDCHKRHEKP